MRAEARERFETGNVDSCCAAAEMRRRSEEELRGREALDNLHGSAAKWTLPKRVNGERGRGGACYWRTGWLEQPQSKRKEFRSPLVNEKAEVADAHKAARQQVQKEAAQELFVGQSHEPLLVAVSGVAPAKGYVALGKSDQSVAGDGDAVGVGSFAPKFAGIRRAITSKAQDRWGSHARLDEPGQKRHCLPLSPPGG